jgi:hypothetical protein
MSRQVKLFELLVNHGQVKGQAQTLRGDLMTSFDKKRHLFEEKLTTFQPIEENAKPVTEAQSDIQTTVAKELRWLAQEAWTRAIDSSRQIAEGNALARADIVLDDGTVLLANVPATALLELEKTSTEIHDLFKTIPTLDPAKGFRPDPAKGPGVSIARLVQKTRTRKVVKVIVKAPATDKHPAQTEMVTVDESAGTIQEQEWSALLTPAQKSEILARAEQLKRSVKTALQRANTVTLDPIPSTGAKVFEFVLGPLG